MADWELACVVGARPNFMKMAPILRALDEYPQINATLIHTGQHYDRNLSDVFFEELGMKPPDLYLNIGGGKHGAQTGRMLEALEVAFEEGPSAGARFDRVLVVGDVNSTLAAALAAVKLNIPVTHVEAGLRSFDHSMPEEINRIVTDSVSDMFFVSEPAGVDNLHQEGHAHENIHFVGNVMIDTQRQMLPAAGARETPARFAVKPGEYGIVTLHRPSNVDLPDVLAGIIDVLGWASSQLPLLFPLHPRTQQRLEQHGLLQDLEESCGIKLLPPFGYLDFLGLVSDAKFVVTDSGGLQEESTVLGVPCLTMRENTERPITVEVGTSTLVGNDPERLKESMTAILEGRYKQGAIPELWDGEAAGRIAQVLAEEESGTCLKPAAHSGTSALANAISPGRLLRLPRRRLAQHGSVRGNAAASY